MKDAEYATPSNLARIFDGARLRIDPKTRDINLKPGRFSPLVQPAVGAIVLRALAQQWLPEDPQSLLAVVEIAIVAPRTVFIKEPRERHSGNDELLLGRAGLLWGILEIWKGCPDQETQAAFAPVFQSIHRLVTVILEAGREAAAAYKTIPQYDKSLEMPLMWTWLNDHISLGAMHGLTGILAILLDTTLQRYSISISESYSEIAGTITSLCAITIKESGHLPLAVPHWPNHRPSTLVQLCHGAPAFLCLMAAAKRNAPFSSQFWLPQWDDAIFAASDVVWKEGLLTKGCSLCHGIGGNALSILLLADPVDSKTDGHLQAGCAMLLEALETPPFKSEEGRYRMPDKPWSLYEGLAGLVCAWSEVCVLLQVKLRVLELEKAGMTEQKMMAKDQVILELKASLQGFPGIVGDAVGGQQVSLV